MDTSQLMNLERQDEEKKRCVNKLVDLCLSLTEQVLHLKDMIESSTMERHLTMLPAPQYSHTTALVEPFIRDIRQSSRNKR